MSSSVAAAHGVALAVVIEPARLAAGLVDAAGDVLVRDRITMPPREAWRALHALVGRVVAAAPGGASEPQAVGVSCVGPVDVDAGAVSPDAVPQWLNFPLAEELAAFTGLRVHLDSAAGAQVESILAGRRPDEPDTFLAVYLDQTVESACAVGGVRLRGAHGNAGSIAHVTVEPNGRPCPCGALGCLAAYAGAIALEEEIGRSIRRASASTVERTGLMVGRAVASARAMFDGGPVYLGGSLVELFGDDLLDVVRVELIARSRLAHLGAGSIVVRPPIPSLVAAANLTRVPSRV